MNTVFNAAALAELAVPRTAPCLSLYQRTHRSRPDNQQDPIRFRNLVKELQASVGTALTSAESRALLQPFTDLADNFEFWNHTMDGLAVFRAGDLFRVFLLHHTVDELAVVADNFHVKPLRRYLQSAERYQVLQLSRGKFRLFEGDRDHLAEIAIAAGVPRTLTEALGDELTEAHHTVASYGGTGASSGAMHHGHGGARDEVDIDAERFFRVVDRGVFEHHSKVTGLPLMLAALPEHHALFRRISQNHFLLKSGVMANTEALAPNALRDEVWKVFEPQHREARLALSDSFHVALARGLGSDNLADVAVASAEGRVATLWIDAEQTIPGKLDAATGHISLADLAHPAVDDVLDDLGELVERMGGTVQVMPSQQMPGEGRVAAIYRH